MRRGIEAGTHWKGNLFSRIPPNLEEAIEYGGIFE
jgi:hypothetical protein